MPLTPNNSALGDDNSHPLAQSEPMSDLPRSPPGLRYGKLPSYEAWCASHRPHPKDLPPLTPEVSRLRAPLPRLRTYLSASQLSKLMPPPPVPIRTPQPITPTLPADSSDIPCQAEGNCPHRSFTDHDVYQMAWQAAEINPWGAEPDLIDERWNMVAKHLWRDNCCKGSSAETIRHQLNAILTLHSVRSASSVLVFISCLS